MGNRAKGQTEFRTPTISGQEPSSGEVHIVFCAWSCLRCQGSIDISRIEKAVAEPHAHTTHARAQSARAHTHIYNHIYIYMHAHTYICICHVHMHMYACVCTHTRRARTPETRHARPAPRRAPRAARCAARKNRCVEHAPLCRVLWFVLNKLLSQTNKNGRCVQVWHLAKCRPDTLVSQVRSLRLVCSLRRTCGGRGRGVPGMG